MKSILQYLLITQILLLSILGCSKKKTYKVTRTLPDSIDVPKGMVWIPGGTFIQGAIKNDIYALHHEKPSHKVAVDGFFMDITEVTNAMFQKFINETNYITTAERKIKWEELKKFSPKNTPKPHDSILVPGTMTFVKCQGMPSSLNDYSKWWRWTKGGDWKHPNGVNSTIKNKENYPVVHITYEDALAYCQWAGRRLPTEAEWEYAARANKKNNVFFWGNNKDSLINYANTWEGKFPIHNTMEDGYERTAPVKSYLPNNFGLYDMSGNVWEWTSDWYNVNYYKQLTNTQKISYNPKGANESYNPKMPMAHQKVIKGGSFLCNVSYCASYRISARMSTTTDSSMEHLGFRTVLDLKMIQKSN